jgi:5'-deoxynucleotidase YfbR-like HD superfamily hydrolase
MENTNIKKVAVDSAAQEYWKLLYKEYGEALVRDIPRRVKAALATSKKIASADVEATVLPLAHVKRGDVLFVEGTYQDDKEHLMFFASFDESGDVKNVRTVDIKDQA